MDSTAASAAAAAGSPAPRPYIGAIVTYWEYNYARTTLGIPRAGIVVRVHTDEATKPTARVDLMTFSECVVPVVQRPYSPVPAHGCWSWPVIPAQSPSPEGK